VPAFILPILKFGLALLGTEKALDLIFRVLDSFLPDEKARRQMFDRWNAFEKKIPEASSYRNQYLETEKQFEEMEKIRNERQNNNLPSL
jgi:hypothetical protein